MLEIVDFYSGVNCLICTEKIHAIMLKNKKSKPIILLRDKQKENQPESLKSDDSKRGNETGGKKCCFHRSAPLELVYPLNQMHVIKVKLKKIMSLWAR